MQCSHFESSIGPRNVSIQLLVDAVSYPRRMKTSATVLQKSPYSPSLPSDVVSKEGEI